MRPAQENQQRGQVPFESLEGIMSEEEIKSIVEEVLEQIEDDDIAENLDMTTRYAVDEESSGW